MSCCLSSIELRGDVHRDARAALYSCGAGELQLDGKYMSLLIIYLGLFASKRR
jgi:hypothetical protein